MIGGFPFVCMGRRVHDEEKNEDRKGKQHEKEAKAKERDQKSSSTSKSADVAKPTSTSFKRCKPVKTEYFGCLGSSVTLRCEMEKNARGTWKHENIDIAKTTNNTYRTRKEGNHCLLEITKMAKELEGEYTCTATVYSFPFLKAETQCDPIELRILKPIQRFEFEKDNVELRFKATTYDRKYEWSLPNGDNVENADEQKYKIDNDHQECKLTIKNYGKEDEGTYICRDKETKEQLTAYHVCTKYKIEVELVFKSMPLDHEFMRNLIDDTGRLLRKPPYHEVVIKTQEKDTEDDAAQLNQIKAVTYFTRERNETEFEEMMSQTDDQASIYILFIADGKHLPKLLLNQTSIAIRYKERPNNVKCAFFDDRQKDKWSDFLKEPAGYKKSSQ